MSWSDLWSAHWSLHANCDVTMPCWPLEENIHKSHLYIFLCVIRESPISCTHTSLIKQWTITRVLLKLDLVPLYKNCEMHNKWNSTRERVCRRLWGHFKAWRRSAVTENGKNAGGAKSICYMHLQVFVNMFLISFHFDILIPYKTSFMFSYFYSPSMEPCHTSSHLGSGVGFFIVIFNLKRSQSLKTGRGLNLTCMLQANVSPAGSMKLHLFLTYCEQEKKEKSCSG